MSERENSEGDIYYECPSDCDGCSCHNAPPCGHCVDHSRLVEVSPYALFGIPEVSEDHPEYEYSESALKEAVKELLDKWKRWYVRKHPLGVCGGCSKLEQVCMIGVYYPDPPHDIATKFELSVVCGCDECYSFDKTLHEIYEDVK